MNPSDYEWHIIAEFEEIEIFWDDFETTRRLLGVETCNWNMHWFTKDENKLNNSRQMDVTLLLKETMFPVQMSVQPKSIQMILEELVKRKSNCELLLWFLYDYEDGVSYISSMENKFAFSDIESKSQWHLLCPTSSSYDVSTSKIAMKEKFEYYNVATAKWTDHALNEIEFSNSSVVSWFIKPDHGAASVGQLAENRVYDFNSMKKVWDRVESLGYGVIAESFIQGREVTFLVCGTLTNPVVFNGVERVFDLGVDGFQMDECWDNFHFKELSPDDPWSDSCKKLAIEAYRAVGCYPYARVDIRGNLVLEVNAVPAYSLVHLKYSMASILKNDPVNWKMFWNAVWDAKRKL